MKVLVLGNSRTPEMQPVRSLIEQHAAGSSVEQVASIDHAVRLAFGRNWFADLGIVCQHWPDEFSRSDVERLLGLSPVTRWICCFGAWCESDGRNRDIWPLSVRTPVRCADPRIQRELAVLNGQRSALPLTAARDGIFEFDCFEPPSDLEKREKEGSDGKLVLVKTPDYALRQTVSCLLANAGYRLQTGNEDLASNCGHVISDGSACTRNPTIRNPQSGHPRQRIIRNFAAVVWDVDPWSDTVLSQLRDFSARNPDTAIVALAGFAHPEDFQAAHACGVDAVVTKLATPVSLPQSLAAAISSKRAKVA